MADASDVVHPDIIARGRWLFLEFWECLWGRASWEPITRYITDPEPADRYVVIYAALYAVNTKCEHCHAGFINSGRPSAQVVLGHQECECSCCTAPPGYSDCVYCQRVAGRARRVRKFTPILVPCVHSIQNFKIRNLRTRILRK